MVKLNIVGDPNLKEQIQGFLEDDESKFLKTGLILGQRNLNKDSLFLTYLSRTPIQAPEDDDDDDGDQQDPPQNLNGQVDLSWIVEHGKQTIGMLPGGFQVLGLMVIDSSDDIFNPQLVGVSKIRKIIRGLSNLNEDETENEEYLVLHLNNKNHKQTLKSIEANGSSFKPVDLKYENIKWQKLVGNFILDFPTLFLQKPKSLKSQFDIVLNNVEKVLQNQSTVLFDGMVRKSDEFLNTAVKEVKSTGGKKKGKREMVQEVDDEDLDEDIKTYEVAILLDDDNIFEDFDEDNVVMEASGKIRLGGKVHINAFLHERASVKEAVSAVYQDIVRSLKNRFNLHCDYDQVVSHSEEPNNETVLHEPPRRILITLPDSAIQISDYLKPGETTYESIETIKEIFGFTPDEETMDDEIEMVASPSEIKAADEEYESAPEMPKTTVPSSMKTHSANSISSLNPIHILLGVGIGVVAFCIYMIMQD